ncbi:5-(carboxyamino)imidazole ribonucleotide synthase [Saccharibacter floricola]|uniref:N5-carboxyaminoimidazole ribonucleotide synthase n=1 Tax=Saccharibacter floricola DSM 15669 TaxID=1123227 RepID=A0ABQ0P1D7_9PROT|nr:5-(carboxyamino)imidazole ribonucleotide synthase [Saccharibacter floricola]GBQ09017.1 phosphoribosylaminoimidazole carboxylase ATPase subunit [Saccharibacter floricola DSM 15669]
MTPALPPGSTIGIIGGGQLGRMSAVAASRLGYHVHILSASTPAPAAETAAKLTVGSYDDPAVLEAFARECDVITFEFENISAAGLRQLEALRPVHPAGRILEISQDRIAEKTTLSAMGLPVASWRSVQNEDDLATLKDFGFPLILKTTRFGYDGKGQFRVSDETAFQQLWNDRQNLPYPLVAEKKIDFARELSVMVARNHHGDIRCFDPSENRHRDGILRMSMVPAPVAPETIDEAQRIASCLAKDIGLVGILGVELFQNADGQLIINEIAPRPHNSGHWTQNACIIDQFEMHIRAVAGLPLPSTRRHSDGFMHNLIGPDDMALVPAMMEEDNAALHLYGKAEARPGRKMGHINRIFPRGGLPGEHALAQLQPVHPQE